MKGCRPLTNSEILTVVGSMSNSRDRLLVILGISTGFRISELLSLKVVDVFQNGQALNRASVSKCNTKGKQEGRSVAIDSYTQDFISTYIKEEALDEDMPIFYSRKGGAIDRRHAWRILKRGFAVAGLVGKLATHTLRKTTAKTVYEASGNDILTVQKVLGHKSLSSTSSYLSADQDKVDNIMTNMNLFKAA